MTQLSVEFNQIAKAFWTILHAWAPAEIAVEKQPRHATGDFPFHEITSSQHPILMSPTKFFGRDRDN